MEEAAMTDEHQSSQMDTFREIVKRTTQGLVDVKIRMFDDGWDYVVIVVNDSTALRFPRKEAYAKTLPTEVKFLKVFDRLSPVRIPRLSYKQDKKTGTRYVTYPFIPGVQFTKSFSANCSKREMFIIAQQLGLFLTAIHSFPIEKAEQLGILRVNAFEFWKKQLRKIEKEVFPHISVTEQTWVINTFEEFIKIIKERPIFPVLIHSDIGPEHIIVNPYTHSLSGIIDFGDIEIADPAYDFTFLALYGLDFLHEVYRNYGLPRDKSFEKRRQFYRESKFVTNLEHSFELQDQERIKIHKNQLSEYINSQYRMEKQ